jgi:hypothetical protein
MPPAIAAGRLGSISSRNERRGQPSVNHHSITVIGQITAQTAAGVKKLNRWRVPRILATRQKRGLSLVAAANRVVLYENSLPDTGCDFSSSARMRSNC